MTYYSTCLNCAVDKEQCTRRQMMRQALKGLGVTSVKFTCPDRASKFRRGQRVEFDWRYYDEDDVSGEGWLATFYGTVVQEKLGNKRFVVRVDQEGEYYDINPSEILKSPEFISVRPQDMRALDEPDWLMCLDCAAYNDETDVKQRCYNSGMNCEAVRSCAARTFGPLPTTKGEG